MAKQEAHSLVSSSFPVLLPPLQDVKILLDQVPVVKPGSVAAQLADDFDGFAKASSYAPQTSAKSSFMQGLLGEQFSSDRTLTANGDLAYKNTGSVLVDLFSEVEEVTDVMKLEQLLSAAWSRDALATLKLIWSTRSIHLGKSSRLGFYRCIGWLWLWHPRVFLYNLSWLVRPVIKKAQPKQGDKPSKTDENDLMDIDNDSDFEIIDAIRADKKPSVVDPRPEVQFDVKYGLAHGYWKDLLNLLVLASERQLGPRGSIKAVLNPPKIASLKQRDWTPGHRKRVLAERHKEVVRLLKTDESYREFHVTVARLFADQLRVDLERLKSGKISELKRISMAAKWAPSNKGSADRQTFIVTTIAELLYPMDTASDDEDRAVKIKQARIAYQSQYLAPLRKHLDVVERKITEQAYDQIDYSHVPSLAMRQYSKLFLTRDLEHFEAYITDVAQGKARISGAVLLPSVLISNARNGSSYVANTDRSFTAKRQQIEQRLAAQMLDGQWKTLVKRIKDSGKLESSIAICDVSGSMTSPRFADGTTPMDSAVGLSLLLAEVIEPPFGGAFITFSSTPEVVQVGGEQDTRTLKEKCDAMIRSSWGMATDFEAVFSDLILPMARKHNLKQEDMVKRVFVFSDMQFNQANHGKRWSSSYERIKKSFREAGYVIPELVFWNLASNTGSQPKPVRSTEPGTALVSGYSQAMLKVFLEGGAVDEQAVKDQQVVLVKNEKTGEVTEQVEDKEVMTPVRIMEKAISHEAYSMLRVVI